MNTRDPQALPEKLKALPPERVAKVEDFVDFDGTGGRRRIRTRYVGVDLQWGSSGLQL